MADNVDQRPSAVVLHDASGRFAKGNPGRVPGSKNKVSHAAMSAVRDMKDTAIEVLRTKLANGDFDAMVYVLDRILPKGRIVEMEDTSAATLKDMLASGQLTVTELKDIATAFARINEIEQIDELRSRLDALESLVGHGEKR